MNASEGGSGTPDGAASNVVRLPRRPRRGREDAGDAERKPWSPDPVYDPAPTRPVTRAELQAATESWPADAPPPTGRAAGHEGNVIDLDESRRNRAKGDVPARAVRPKMTPRRIGPGERT
ncbi:hypothetical protein [Nocardia rhizosphaerae]|uniref:Uncharacterized protein n=1 Tax=Nocardia rhizosphaerae TaxID=1691571 RepID=A0ABV8LDB2_9NOCA